MLSGMVEDCFESGEENELRKKKEREREREIKLFLCESPNTRLRVTSMFDC